MTLIAAVWIINVGVVAVNLPFSARRTSIFQRVTALDGAGARRHIPPPDTDPV